MELLVLGGVDERVDTAVGEHQHHGQVVPPASEVERVAQRVAKEYNLVWRPAGEKYAAYYQPRDNGIASCFSNGRVTSGIHLTDINLYTSLTIILIIMIIIRIVIITITYHSG